MVSIFRDISINKYLKVIFLTTKLITSHSLIIYLFHNFLLSRDRCQELFWVIELQEWTKQTSVLAHIQLQFQWVKWRVLENKHRKLSSRLKEVGRDLRSGFHGYVRCSCHAFFSPQTLGKWGIYQKHVSFVSVFII